MTNPTTTATKQSWNAPKDLVNASLSQAENYVLIGKNRDGSSFVMSNSDQNTAQELVHSAIGGADQGGNFNR